MARKPVTSQDVAKRAGVSRTTVSFVLNDVPGVKISPDTRHRVLEAARDLDYYPTAAARSLASGKTQRIALILGEGQARLAADAFLPILLQGITASVHRCGYRLLLQLPEDVPSREAYVRLIREQQVDGLILSGPREDDPLLQELAHEQFPLVLHGQVKDSPFPWVDVDNQAGAYWMVSHLIRLGHRRVGFISNAPFFYSGAQERYAGYRQALAEHGIRLDESLVRWGSFLPTTGQAAMNELLRLPHRPTAVFGASDVMAIGAMSAIQSAGLQIPGDVAVAGFDDIFLADHTHPRLTTMRVPAYRLGWTAAELLIGLIQGAKQTAPVVLETELVVRESCGALASPISCATGPADQARAAARLDDGKGGDGR